eukprot:CAMPEP_0174912602 /NCGR_PEP_ID=MMETSP0167-20121228/79872_1 /TAXON_ID=38298 /ORGANISM="Rhodella maculata, Strain CCMP736" /LENGTH=81 /DNA_ID=CAMNT_0016157261 /DNA_START=950 /DNA_END=1195 /DNA_ORIENTATION=-
MPSPLLIKAVLPYLLVHHPPFRQPLVEVELRGEAEPPLRGEVEPPPTVAGRGDAAAGGGSAAERGGANAALGRATAAEIHW